MPAVDAGEADRDEPRGAEAAPARKSGKPHREKASPGDTRAARSTAGRRPAGAIKAAFRQTVKAITRPKEEEPKPQTRRRRGDSDRALRMTARATLRRVPPLPPQAFATATAFLADTLDWLNLWHDADASEPDDNPDVYRNDLPLRL
jgi:hypothetical protein